MSQDQRPGKVKLYSGSGGRPGGVRAVSGGVPQARGAAAAQAGAQPALPAEAASASGGQGWLLVALFILASAGGAALFMMFGPL